MPIVDRLSADLALGRIRSVAFVVPSEARATLPLYEVAIATARRGWQLGLEGVRYWFVTPEREPVNVAICERLEPEGIEFVGSTYPDVRGRVVLLDPQGETIEADRVVSLDDGGAYVRVVSAHELLTDCRPSEPLRPAAVAA